jgi:hypothetical protein
MVTVAHLFSKNRPPWGHVLARCYKDKKVNVEDAHDAYIYREKKSWQCKKITLKFGRTVVWKMKLTMKKVEGSITCYKDVVEELDILFSLTP